MAANSYKKYFYCFFITALAASSPQLLQAQQTATDSSKTRVLEEVIINGRKNNLRNHSATPLQLLNSTDIERVNSFSVAEAIRYFSGVQLKDYGGIGGLKTINIRSMGTNHTAVFYNGIEIRNAQNGQVDLGKVSLDNIEEIALYNGQKSSIFQPAKGFAASSSLYLTASTPKFDSGKVSNEKITFKTGSFGLINPSFLWNYKISPAVSATLSTEYLRSNGKYKFNYTNGVYDTTAVRQNGDINALRTELGLMGKLKDSSTWTVHTYFYGSKRGLPGAILANKFSYSQRQWDRNIFIQGSYQKDIGPKYSLLLNAKYANDYTRYLDPDYVTTSGSLDNRYNQQEAYFSVANQYHLNSFWDIALSADYEWNKLDANIYRFPYPVRNSLLVNGATELHFPKLDIQLSVLGTFVNDDVERFASAGSKQEYSPSALFSWQPFDTKSLHVRGFYKKIFRLPTFNDLYYTFVGNTFLKPEYTEQYDLGLTWSKLIAFRKLKYVSLQADAYYNNVTDKIVAIPSANLFRWTMYNLGKVTIKGFELNVQSDWIVSRDVGLMLSGSYTYQEALDKTKTDGHKNQIPYTPLNSGSLVAAVSWRAASLNYSFIYTGFRYDESANIPANYLQPWYTHDLSLGCRPVKKIKLTVEVNNFLNQYYDVINNFPMPGRSYRLTVSYAI